MRLSAILAFILASVGTGAALIAFFLVLPAGNWAPVLYLFGWLAFALVGAVLGTRRPRNPIGWIFIAMGVSSEIGLLAEIFRDSAVLVAGSALERVVIFLGSFWFIAFQLLAALLILFPDGRPPSRRWRIALWLIALNLPLGVLTSGVDVSGADVSGADVAATTIGPPLADLLGVDVATLVVSQGRGLASLALMALTIVGAAALIVRFRRSRGVERHQLKWIALAGALVAFALVATTAAFYSPLRALDPDAPFPVALFGGAPFVFALVTIPIAAGIAILRYRLYDIDLLINRTVVYGATSVTIAVTFFVGIVALQAALRPLTQGGELAVAASTLVSFALFQPIRRRVQDAVDRRFDRSRYDAARMLDDFADRLRDEVDLASLHAELIAAVGTTVAPAHASLWLRERTR